MLGQNPTEQQDSLFSYHIHLDRRVGANHPLRKIKSALDLSFVVPGVRHCYGRSGNVSVDPVVIMKLMFLLFYYDIASERELMEQLAYRLDFLWFIDYNLESPIPDHSVLSKARKRWGTKVFQRLFEQTVQQCVKAGLVQGQLLHADSTIIKADASKDSVEHLPQFISRIYQEQERKLELLPSAAGSASAKPEKDHSNAVELTVYDPKQEPPPAPTPTAGAETMVQVLPAPATIEADQVNKNTAEPLTEPVSLSDPDAQFTLAKNGLVELSYKEHRLVDDAHGVITAMELTRSQVHDSSRVAALTQQHEDNTHFNIAGSTLTGDQHYGTVENFRFCHEQGIVAHMAPAQAHLKERGNFEIEQFVYEAVEDRYRCPAGHYLKRLQVRPEHRQVVYRISQAGLCAECPMRAQCTKAKLGRTLVRYEDQPLVDRQRQEALSPAAVEHRKRRKHIAEGSFAQGANCCGMKRARWRRLWRQQIQSWLICAVQNLKVLVAKGPLAGQRAAAAAMIALQGRIANAFLKIIVHFSAYLRLVGSYQLPNATR